MQSVNANIMQGPNLIKERTAKELVPPSVMFTMSIKIYMMGALAWDYADTVLDLLVQGKISETKKVARQLRDLRTEYLRFRRKYGDTLEEEDRLGLMFEELNQKRIDKLYKHLAIEVAYTTQLSKQWQAICASALTALTMLDAMKLYARHCDKRIDNYGVVRQHTILQEDFFTLANLLAKIIDGKCNPRLVTRSKVAEELYAEVLALETFEVADSEVV